MTQKQQRLSNQQISTDLNSFKGAVANQLFRRTFRNSKFFETHVHLGVDSE